MSEETQKTIVSSWNEWDPLKHVIVGRADGTMIQAPEPAVQRDWPEDGFPLGKFGPYPQEMQDKANYQLDNFVKILEGRGIRVDRPTPMDFSQEVQTPDWEQETMFGCGPIRDILLTVGNEILEATMSYRSRWFEFLCYRPLFEQYFKEDPNFRFEAAPKPRLTERTYKKGWWDEWNAMTESEQFERAEKSDWIITEKEPLFDAADVVRFGKDLIVQNSMVTNNAGIDWLGRHFPNHRVHKVGRRELLPWHLDSTLVPFRPGFALVNPTRPSLGEKEWEFFKKNDWELVETPKSLLKKKQPYDFCSWWLNMNTLSLGPDTVCVEASETPVMELLDKRGFEVVPVPFYDVSAFGGGLHCSTADVYRVGSMEDYFPNQVEGF
jgi:glycine amidinotransferase